MTVKLTKHKVTKFKFITSTSTYNPTREDRKQIKSHVSRGRPRRQQRQGAKSWILQRDGQLTNLENDGTPIPGRVGSDLSLVNFPEDLKPYMQEDFTQCMTPKLLRHGANLLTRDLSYQVHERSSVPS